MFAFGAGLLAVGTVVGRPYCRFLCPYGALLGIVSRVAWRQVQITPDEELDCGLCTEACPFGAIRSMRAVPATCVACARCFAHCPRQQLAWGEIELYEIENLVADQGGRGSCRAATPRNSVASFWKACRIRLGGSLALPAAAPPRNDASRLKEPVA